MQLGRPWLLFFGISITLVSFCPNSAQSPKQLRSVIRQAFLDTHDGYSSDEVLLNDQRRNKFLDRCRALSAPDDEFLCNWSLLTLRKSGRLNAKVTRRNPQRHDEYWHAAEIAARWVFDQHGATIDRVICDPVLRREFDKAATHVSSNVPAYARRKAAFALRKARRLRPELVARVADWGRQIVVYSLDQLRFDPTVVPDAPGIYIFRDNSGYLYVGQSENLRRRLGKHLDQSDRVALANYLAVHATGDGLSVELHVFLKDSRGSETIVRRAYESDLIVSRKPRFNIQP